MTDYAFHQLDANVSARLGLPPLALPIRRDRRKEIFGDDKVHLDLALNELRRFLAENPGERERYRAAASALARITGVELATEGYAADAAHAFEIGLAADPASASLRMSYVLALASLGRHAEALAQCERMLADPAAARAPHLRLLAARLCREVGQFERGYGLLRSLVPLVPEENGFWDLLAELEEKSGRARPAARATQPTQPTQPSAPAAAPPVADAPRAVSPSAPGAESSLRFCPSCGAAAQTNWKFCGQCGAKLA